MKVINNNTLVKYGNQTTTLGNGLSVNVETQNRKDIVTGTVIQSTNPEIKGTVWFPLYAASVVTTGGQEYYVVNNDDIMLVDD